MRIIQQIAFDFLPRFLAGTATAFLIEIMKHYNIPPFKQERRKVWVMVIG